MGYAMNNLIFIWSLIIGLAANAQLTLPGESSELALLMGYGYNAVKGTVSGVCVDLGKIDTQSGSESGQIAEYRLLQISSERDLQTSLSIQASMSLKASTFGVGGSGRMSFASSVNRHSNSKYLLVHTRVSNQIELASDFRFKKDRQQFLNSLSRKGINSTEFTDQCGTHFVYGRRTGGEFYALFEFEMHSDEEERSFSAAVKVSGVGWKSSTKIDETLKQFNQYSITQVKQFRVGASDAWPESDNLEEYARNYPKQIALTKGSRVTLELILKDYQGVQGFDSQNNLKDLNSIALNIESDLADKISEINGFLNVLNEVKRNRSKYNYGEIYADINKAIPVLNKSLQIAKSAAKKCLTEKPIYCEYPSNIIIPELPDIRKVDSSNDVIKRYTDDICINFYKYHRETCSYGPPGSQYPLFRDKETKPFAICQCP